MKSFNCLALAAAISAYSISQVEAKKYTFGVLSDIHLQPNYSPTGTVPNYCEESSQTDSSQLLNTVAYFGRLGCDVPETMVDAAFAKMAHDNADLDAIFVPGDLIGHGISIDLKYDKDITDE